MGYTHGIKYSEEDMTNKIMELANMFDPVRMPSRQEIEDYYGDTSLTNKISRTGGHYYWAKKLGLEIKHSETRLGIHAENVICDLLLDMGYTVEKTSLKYPYDLLVDGCVKIDVKAANVSYVRGSKIRAYRIAKRQQTCDFYILCEVDGDQVSNVYVVPSVKVTGQIQVEMGDASTMYAKYRDRYDFIQKTVEFYDSIA